MPVQTSPASFGRRLAALGADALIAVITAGAFTFPKPPVAWSSVALFLSYTLFTGLFGQTPGMQLLGLACVNVTDGRPLGVPRAALRALMLQLVLPALMLDGEGRGWHDRATRSIVLKLQASDPS